MRVLQLEDLFERLDNKAQESPRPFYGHWDLTYQCNLSCRHCYLAGVKKAPELSYPEVTAIIDQIAAEGCLHLAFSGGEPFLRPDFKDIYSYAVNKGILLTILTNCTLINEDTASWLAANPPLMIEITVHSLKPGVFDSITASAGAFEQCMRGIEALKRYDLPVTIKIVGLKENKNDIGAVKEFSAGLGKDRFKFDTCVLPGHDGSKAPCTYRLPPQEAAEVEFSDIQINKQWCDFLASDRARPADGSELFFCAGGLRSFYISPDGDLRLCLPLVAPAFNLKKGSFKQGFYSFLQELRGRRYTKKSACQRCDLFKFCAQCPAKAWLENGDMEKPVEYFCQVAKERAKRFNRIQ